MGVSYQVTVKAVDDYFNTVISYSGNVSLTTSDTNDTDPTSLSCSNGEATFTVTNYTANDNTLLTPATTGLTTNVITPLKVTHGVPANIIVKLPGQTFTPGKALIADALTGSPTDRRVNEAYAVDVYVVDQYHNVCSIASGPKSVAGTSVSLVSSDTNDTDPGTQAFSNGQTSYVVTPRTIGTNQTLTPTHTNLGSVTQVNGLVSEQFDVLSAAATPNGGVVTRASVDRRNARSTLGRYRRHAHDAFAG